jgi:phospholipid transport system substrate-binding protein
MHASRWTAAAVAVLIVAAAAPASAAAGEATAAVRATVDRVLATLRDPQLAGPTHTVERRARIRAIVLERFRFDEMAKRSLGAYWPERTPAERTEFVHVFTDLLARSYVSRIDGYSGQPIVYLDESVDGDRAEVRSEVVDHLTGKTSIEYRLLRGPSDWRVYDVVIDGVSLVNNYRTQFAQIIGRSSYSDLLRRMRSKLASERNEERAGRRHTTR